MSKSKEKRNIIKLGDLIFKEINLDDIEMYSYFKRNTNYPVNLWSSNFDFLWSFSKTGKRKVIWKTIDDMLVMFGYTIKNTLYLICLPLGEGDSEKVVDVLYKCMSFCYEYNNNKSSKTLVRTINQPQLDFLRLSDNFDKYFKIKKLKGIERHYGVNKLLALKGKDFSSIRNKINKFNRENPNAIFRECKPEDYEDLIKLNEVWKEKSGNKHSNVFDEIYYKETLKKYNELKHKILVVEVDKKIVGMVSGGESDDGQAWGCFIKALSDIPGIYEKMVIEFVHEINHINPNITLINVGSDLGAKGLIQFKEKFKPVLNLERYRVNLKKAFDKIENINFKGSKDLETS